jgi:large conductance mechanosensitive channel
MPPIGILMGKIDFANLFFVLMDGTVPGPYASLEVAQNAGAVTMNVGIFLNALISFVIVAFAVFLLIKAINTLQEKMLAAEKKEEAAAPTTKKCPYCCSEIPLEATRCPHCTSELK